MTEPKRNISAEPPDTLFGRVETILDQARGNVVRAVNTQMVLAYWLIGREIVQAVQGGEERAAYGKGIVTDLSKRLTQRYGQGYSAQVLWSFRQFYLAYSERGTILFPAGRESLTPEKLPGGYQISARLCAAAHLVALPGTHAGG